MKRDPSAVISTISPSLTSWTLRVSAEEGRDRRGDEALAVAQPDDERALLARAHQHSRVVGRHRDEGVVAAQLVVGAADGLGEVAVQVLGDQVGDHLGVGLGGELGAVGLEPLAQVGPVLDDPVQHDVHAVRRCRSAGGRSPRSRGRGWPSACGRCRSSRARARSPSATASRSFCRLPTAWTLRDGVVGEQRYARGVIAAVLEAPQPLQQEVAAFPRSYVSNDPAHDRISVSTTRRFSPALARSPRTRLRPAPRP